MFFWPEFYSDEAWAYPATSPHVFNDSVPPCAPFSMIRGKPNYEQAGKKLSRSRSKWYGSVSLQRQTCKPTSFVQILSVSLRLKPGLAGDGKARMTTLLFKNSYEIKDLLPGRQNKIRGEEEESNCKICPQEGAVLGGAIGICGLTAK